MNEIKNNHAPDLRRGVASGLGFLDTYRREAYGNSEAIRHIEVLGYTLSLLGKRPRKEPVFIFTSESGNKLDRLFEENRRTRNEQLPGEGFLRILQQLPDMTRYSYAPTEATTNDTEEQEKFYAFNALVAQGVSPQEAEAQVERAYSNL